MIRVRSSTAAKSGVATTYMPVMKPDTLAGGVGESGGLQDLRDAVQAAEDDARGGATRRTAGRSARGATRTSSDRRDREAHREEVEGRHPVEQVVDQEERAAPASR